MARAADLTAAVAAAPWSSRNALVGTRCILGELTRRYDAVQALVHFVGPGVLDTTMSASCAVGVRLITLGVDLAAEPRKTDLARIAWRAGSAHITDVRRHVTDDDMVEAIVHADKAGIDCPLGWPVKFIRFITSHDSGHVCVAARGCRQGVASGALLPRDRPSSGATGSSAA
jgi:hypothetical protein